nr:MAG TPA: hypothetical protein [Caudoviricetes sp.]
MDYAAMEAVADLCDMGVPPHEAELMARFVGVPAEDLIDEAKKLNGDSIPYRWRHKLPVTTDLFTTQTEAVEECELRQRESGRDLKVRDLGPEGPYYIVPVN